jgi:YfiH family protein
MIQPKTLTAPGLGSAFFTREGGVSGGLYAALNCGYGSGDDPEAVRENRRRAMDRLGLKPEALGTLYQIHSPTVVTVEAPWRAGESPKADGAVTNRRGIALGILTADCAPVLFADPDAGVIGAAHAGWRGAFGGVLEATVTAMVALGAKPAAITAAIGPTIAQPSYEVDEAFHRRLVEHDPDNATLFRPGREGLYQFDLPGYVRHRLLAAGVERVDNLALDTYSDPARFHSYRRATHRREADDARLFSLIAL